jgi:hypothetical protein
LRSCVEIAGEHTSFHIVKLSALNELMPHTVKQVYQFAYVGFLVVTGIEYEPARRCQYDDAVLFLVILYFNKV